jgi:hypothetical protein
VEGARGAQPEPSLARFDGAAAVIARSPKGDAAI